VFSGESLPEEAGINIRPYTMECLEEVSKHFHVIVWTAAV